MTHMTPMSRMNAALRGWKTPLLVATVAITLSGCVSLGGGKSPPFLLTLDAAVQPSTSEARTAAQGNTLTILVPNAPQKLRTTRIPVQQDQGSVAYVADAQWVEAPQRLFQHLLSATVAARSSRVVLDEGQYLTAPGEQLAGELLEFGVDARSNQAVIVYQAMLVNNAGKTVTQRRFEAREPVSGKIAARNSGLALQNAANRMAVEISDWLATTPAN